MSVVIGGLQKSSLLDFPDKISAIVFTQGCNFRCGYCHNPELCIRLKEPHITTAAFLDFLKSRKGKLDGVVITGGEPTLYNDLPEFINEIKSSGFAVKLDTNGTNPGLLEELFKRKLLDYAAMDIKAPLNRYEEITNTHVDTEKIQKSIDLIMNSGIDYEFRTTVVRSQLCYEDFEKIAEMIKGAKRYYLQKFVPSKTLDERFYDETSYTDDEFSFIAEKLRNRIESVFFR